MIEPKWYSEITAYQWRVLICACLGWALDIMDGYLYAIILFPAMSDLLGTSESAQIGLYGGVVLSIFMIGWALGGLIFGPIADRYGRAKTMAITILIYASFTGLCGIASSWQELAVFRFLTGIGIGGEWAAGAALIAESWPAGGFEAHRYLGRIRFERSAIDRIELQHLRPDAQITISRVSLFDSESGTSTPLTSSPLSAERWRKVASLGGVDVFENLRMLPRAWFAKRVTAVEDRRILARIQGRDENALFEPNDEALVDSGSSPEAVASTSPAQGTLEASVVVTRYEPNRISLKTKNDNPGFLVLSEIYYPGWIASIDGRRARVHRTNYVLRGVSVPAGEHEVEFTFRSRSFLQGAYLSGAGAGLLLVSLVLAGWAHWRQKTKLTLRRGSSSPPEPLPARDETRVIRDPD